MTRKTLALLAMMVALTPAFGDDAESPHHMVKPDGTADMDKCAACHQEDLSLARSKAETCTLCHATTPHSGAAEHLAATAASVARLLAGKGESGAALPLTEDDRIYCGTCHLFHDPAISAETLLATAWARSSAGLADAIRRARVAQWKEIAQKYGQPGPGAEFAAKGTRALRLPIDDGSLCRHCHGYGR